MIQDDDRIKKGKKTSRIKPLSELELRAYQDRCRRGESKSVYKFQRYLDKNPQLKRRSSSNEP